MDTLPNIDYVGAVAIYTPWIMGIAQAMKQSPRVDNMKLPYYCILLGALMAVGMLVVAGKILWTPHGLILDPIATFKALVEGTFGGTAAPAGYFLQKQMPIQLLSPGPDNYVAPPVKPPETPDNPKP